MVLVELNKASKYIVIKFHGDTAETPERIKIKSMHEFLTVYNAARTWWHKSSMKEYDEIYAPYKGELKKVYDKLVLSRHLKEVFDVSASFLPQTGGTSKIIRFNSKGILSIVRRKKRDRTTRNGICVDNETRDMFIHDCTLNGDTTKLSLREASNTYLKWSKILDEEYGRQYTLWKQNEMN